MRLAMDLEELTANKDHFISCLTTNYNNETTPYNLANLSKFPCQALGIIWVKNTFVRCGMQHRWIFRKYQGLQMF